MRAKCRRGGEKSALAVLGHRIRRFPGLGVVTLFLLSQDQGSGYGNNYGCAPTSKSWFCVFSVFLQHACFTCEIRKGSTSYCYSVMIEDNCGIYTYKISHFNIFFPQGKFFQRRRKIRNACPWLTNVHPSHGGVVTCRDCTKWSPGTGCFICFPCL